MSTSVLSNIGHGTDMAETGSGFWPAAITRWGRIGICMAARGGRFARDGWRWRSARGKNLGQQEKRREEKRREEKRREEKRREERRRRKKEKRRKELCGGVLVGGRR